jgi:Raf kinase inhibitor-like YbhB/YbcL family protein
MIAIREFLLSLGIMTLGTSQAAEFALTSPDVGPDKPLAQEFVYDKFGCTGGNQSPALSWGGAPAGTKSYAVALFDPDAIRGRGFWHWLVVNLPATTTSLARDAGKVDGSNVPAGAVQIKNGFRANGYSGSCPPPGEPPHGYTYTVYALKTEKIEVPADADSPTVLNLIKEQSLGNATLVYRFGREKKE